MLGQQQPGEFFKLRAQSSGESSQMYKKLHRMMTNDAHRPQHQMQTSITLPLGTMIKSKGEMSMVGKQLNKGPRRVPTPQLSLAPRLLPPLRGHGAKETLVDPSITA